MLPLLLLALALAAASPMPCGERTYYIEATGECVTEEQCKDRGREPREGQYCREVHEVSKESQLLKIGEAPYEAYVLTRDITLRKPWRPTDFCGEIDGQGHWIKGIRFGLEEFYSPENTYIGLFPNVAVLKNIGLKAAVGINNTVGRIPFLQLGIVSGYTRRPVLVHDVVLSGSVSVSRGPETIEYVEMGSLFGGQYSESAVIGPNVTSYCSLSCRAENCYVGGLAYSLYGAVTGVAVRSSSVALDAGNAQLGGIAAYCHSPLVAESFAELEGVSLTVGEPGALVGGLLADYDSAGSVRDCYATLSHVLLNSGQNTLPSVYLSPFIGRRDSSWSKPLAIQRCYGWLKDPLGVQSVRLSLVLGGLAADVRASLEVSSSFAILGDSRGSGSGRLRGVCLGGLVGQALSGVSGGLTVSGSWARSAYVSASAVDDLRVGGVCGDCGGPAKGIALTDLAVDLTLSPEVASQGGAAIGALAGQMSGALAVGVMVEYYCVGEGAVECHPVPLVSSGADVRVEGTYVGLAGGGLVPGVEQGDVAVVNGVYNPGAYPELGDWDFHEGAYPTLPSLPVPDRGGRNRLLSPPGSLWADDTWVVPDTWENGPQLVTNLRCKGEGGGPLCVSCAAKPENDCGQCERGRVYALGGCVRAGYYRGVVAAIVLVVLVVVGVAVFLIVWFVACGGSRDQCIKWCKKWLGCGGCSCQKTSNTPDNPSMTPCGPGPGCTTCTCTRCKSAREKDIHMKPVKVRSGK